MHGHLVGGVQHAGRGAARLGGLAGEPQAGERLRVRGLEGQLAELDEVERPDRHVDALRIVQGVGDRNPHVGVAEVGERGAVVQVHEGVHDRLRVDHDVEALVRHAEQVVGLDQLEPLVHERGGVDRDLAAHVPGGVGERLLASHVLEVGAAAEGTAAGGEHEAVDGARPLGGHELVQGGVLGIHRYQLCAGALGKGGHELAADHEALLVREREIDSLAECGDRGAQAGRAHQRVQHEVAVGLGDELHEPLRPGQDLDPAPVLGRHGRGVEVGERDPADAVHAGLLEQELPARRRREAHDLELAAALDHVERLRADRAGGADDEDPAHPTESRERRAARARGDPPPRPRVARPPRRRRPRASTAR